MLRARYAFTTIMMSLVLLCSAPAQTLPIGAVAAQSRDVRTALIPPGTASTLLPFIVDTSGQGEDLFHVISTDPNTVVTLILPNGTEVNSGNAVGLGYSYDVIPAVTPSVRTDSPPSPFTNPGTQTLITLPQTATAGNYQVKINASGAANKTLIVATYYSSSAITASILTDQESYKVGDTVVVSAFVFNNAAPVTNATVAAEVREASIPSVFSQQLSLQDFGTYDAATGDGVYTGSFNAPVAGRYAVVVRATGTSPSGNAFSRAATTIITVRSATANFTTFSASGVDNNGNGRSDQVDITANVSVQTPGKYSFIVSLEGSNGKSVRGSTEATLSSGTQQIKISFPASDFIDLKTGQLLLGTSGPFAMKRLQLRYISDTDTFIADTRDNAGNTGTFSFEREAIIFPGPHTVTAVDLDSNGKIDLLRVEARVDVLTTGNYVWQAKLVDPSGEEVGFYSLSDSQPALLTEGQRTVIFIFSGQIINRSQRNGPYTVETATVYAKSGGATGATAVRNLITTSAYSYTQFEPPLILECRNYQYTLPSGQSAVVANYALPLTKRRDLSGDNSLHAAARFELHAGDDDGQLHDDGIH